MAKPANMPSYIYESLQRQYKGKDYTIEDKKNVINWQKKQAKKFERDPETSANIT